MRAGTSDCSQRWAAGPWGRVAPEGGVGQPTGQQAGHQQAAGVGGPAQRGTQVEQDDQGDNHVAFQPGDP